MPLSKSAREELCREFLGKAKQAFDALFDDGQQEQLITLTQREARILQQGAELHSWLLEKHLAQDPTANPAEVEAIRCPNCHRVGVPAKQKKDAVPRRVKTRAGEQEFTRRKYRCAHCRRRFFPLGR